MWPAPADRCKGILAPVWTPGTRGLNEFHAFVVRIDGSFGELLFCFTCLRINEEQIHRKEIPLRKYHDPLPIGTYGRSYIQSVFTLSCFDYRPRLIRNWLRFRDYGIIGGVQCAVPLFKK